MERLYYLILQELVSLKGESGYPNLSVKQKKHPLKWISCFFMLLMSCISLKAQTIDHWETVIFASDEWYYFIGNSEPPVTWTNIDFDDTSWLTGPGGIGYGDGDDATVISPVASVYLRMNFTLVDTSVISGALLHVDFDDGFVAYLNGMEIARANIGTAGVRPLHSDFAELNTYEAQLPSGGVPARFMVNSDTLRRYMIQGTNVLTVQVHNCNTTSSDLSSGTWLSLAIADASNNYSQPPAWFNEIIEVTSHLPLLVIDTWGQSIVDEPKIKAWLKVIDNGSGKINSAYDDGTDYNGFIGIEVRGQSSQNFPKKSFGFELRDSAGSDLNLSLLGMPEEEDWILYAPYSDKSLFRNSVTFHLGSKMGSWQPRYRFCELYLNGAYHGIYMLMEKIKRDQNRVDISKLNPDEIAGDDLTGGYIVKVDKTGGLTSDDFFQTNPTNTYYDARDYKFSYVYPKSEDIVSEQKTYIHNYILEFENNLNGESFKDPVNGFRKYLDVNSFVDFQIMQELTNNVDGYRFSTFFYKKKDSDGGKFFAGPLWDFDLCYGNAKYSDLNMATNRWLFPNYGPDGSQPMHWWARLMEDAGYCNRFISRWEELRDGPFRTDSIMAYIDSTIEYLGPAVERNFIRWPVLGKYVWPNYFIGETYEEEIGYLKNWITARLNWMDASIHTAGIFEINPLKRFLVVYPNPLSNQMNIRLYLSYQEKISAEIFDLLGKKVFSSEFIPVSAGLQEFQLTVPKVFSGYYILILKQGARIIGRHKVLISNH